MPAPDRPVNNLKGAGPGRPPGMLNKVKGTVSLHFFETLKELDFDPIKEAVKLYRDPDMQPKDKVMLLKDIMSYTYARRKTAEVKETTNNTLNINWAGDANNAKQIIDQTADVLDLTEPAKD